MLICFKSCCIYSILLHFECVALLCFDPLLVQQNLYAHFDCCLLYPAASVNAFNFYSRLCYFKNFNSSQFTYPQFHFT